MAQRLPGQAGEALENGVSEVKPYKKTADNLDALVFMVLADGGLRNDAMIGFLDRDRTHLSVYAKAIFGLGLERLGEQEKLAMVLQNIGQYVVQDDENQTAYLKLPNEGYWWWWYGSEIETDAFYLKLLARTDPKGELTSRLVKYVLNNRKHGSYWNSTRDTAFCIEALADYMRASGEDRPDMTVAIAPRRPDAQGGEDHAGRLVPLRQRLRARRQGRQDRLAHDLFDQVRQRPTLLQCLPEQLHARRSDHPRGPGYKGRSKGLSAEERRRTVSVAGGHGQALGQKVEHYRRELLSERAILKSGELVEIELEIDSKNDYEYVVFEDFKAAGFEPVEVRSGYNGNDMGAYVEYRDDRVAFFSRMLARASTASRTASAPRSPASSTPCPPGHRRCTPRS